MNESRTDWQKWEPGIRATLMFIVQDGKVLLIDKLTGIGKGKINGPGGKIELGETAEQAVIRECQEELHITPLDPVKMGELCFAMTDIPDIHCHVFIATQFTGEPKPTREANPMWEEISKIPYDRMWEDDQYWLPNMLAGHKFFCRFDFEVETIQWMQVNLGDLSTKSWLGDQSV
jgi:8-oxo-dGTP diphosphatase